MYSNPQSSLGETLIATQRQRGEKVRYTQSLLVLPSTTLRGALYSHRSATPYLFASRGVSYFPMLQRRVPGTYLSKPHFEDICRKDA